MYPLPRYSDKAVICRGRDLELITNLKDLDHLCSILYNCDANELANEKGLILKQYFKSNNFKDGAEFFEVELYLDMLTKLATSMLEVACRFGFPAKPFKLEKESDFDFELAKVFGEEVEALGFEVLPGHACSKNVREFMTLRVLAPIVYWRWRVITNKPISEDRVVSSPRNYFYILWLIGYLFDRGSKNSNRWELLSYLSADSLVQIVERSGIGLRKEFAQAIVEERKKRSDIHTSSSLDRYVRGAMKRGVFTFSTSIMLKSPDYYQSIVRYLFNWAEKNYVDRV